VVRQAEALRRGVAGDKVPAFHVRRGKPVLPRMAKCRRYAVKCRVTTALL